MHKKVSMTLFVVFLSDSYSSMKHSASSLSASSKAQIYGTSEGEKGYVQMVTNYGNLNIQVHCDLCPKISEIFLNLSDSNFFDYTQIPRLIPNLILALGDVEITTDQSIDSPVLSHNTVGILTANVENGRIRFSITLSKCPHLDGKQTAFGRVVGGLSILNGFNTVSTDGEDRPISPIKIEKAIVLTNPFKTTGADVTRESVPTYVPRSDPMANHPNRMSMEIGKYIDWAGLPDPCSKKGRTTGEPWSFNDW